jgi:hypothetical protein
MLEPKIRKSIWRKSIREATGSTAELDADFSCWNCCSCLFIGTETDLES